MRFQQLTATKNPSHSYLNCVVVDTLKSKQGTFGRKLFAFLLVLSVFAPFSSASPEEAQRRGALRRALSREASQEDEVTRSYEAFEASASETSFKAGFRGTDAQQVLVENILGLEDRIMKTQVRMAATLNENLKRFDPDRASTAETKEQQLALIRRALAFNVQMNHLAHQYPRLQLTLRRFENELPSSALAEIRRRHDLIQENQLQLVEKHKELVRLSRQNRSEDPEVEEELEKLTKSPPQEEITSTAPTAFSEESRELPRSPGEAVLLLEAGAVRTPQDLTELFEQIPEDQTPTGSLENYQEFIR